MIFHICHGEPSTTSPLFTPERVATLADTFVAHHNPRFRPSPAAKGCNSGKTGAEPSIFSVPSEQNEQMGPVNPQFNKGKTGVTPFSHFGSKRCIKCNLAYHLAVKCLRGQGRGYSWDTREPSCRAQINLCTTTRTLPRVECVTDCVTDKQEGMVSDTKENWEFGEYPSWDSDATEAPTQRKVKISLLKVINIQVDDISARALKDSGDQIPLLGTGIFGERSLKPLGNIMVRGILVNLSLLLWLM